MSITRKLGNRMQCKLAQRIGLFLLTAAVGTASAHATSCMVMGENTARVQSVEGEKSPVFLTASCEELRLVSGKAMVSWVSRDGKPHFSSIGKNGADGLPAKGAEERSANVVWAELTSKREAERPAFMRALNEERPARVYIPPEGLPLSAKADADFRILALQDGIEKSIYDKKSSDVSPILLTRDRIKPGGVYLIEWHQAGGIENVKWQTVSEAETARIDAQYQEIVATIPDEQQRRIMMDMMFEQLKLRVNISSSLSRF